MSLHNYAAISPSHPSRKNCKSRTICSVYGCHNRSEAGLYQLPSEVCEKKRREEWICILRMEKVPKYTMVCGKHFTEDDFIPSRKGKGKIKRLKKTAVPSQNLPKSKIYRSPPLKKKQEIQNRTERMHRRSLKMSKRSSDDSFLLPVMPDSSLHLQLSSEQLERPILNENSLPSTADNISDPMVPDISAEIENLAYADASVQVNTILERFDFGVRLIDFIDTDAKLGAFTGINSFVKFETICEAAEILITNMAPTLWNRTALCLRERILLTLMKLKLNIRFTCLGTMFNVSLNCASEIFFSTIDLLYEILKDFVNWPSKENIRDNLPEVFRKDFPNTRVIVDCTEINVQQFSCLICKTRTYSNYKCHHTVKFMIGIAPSGVITFVSHCFGGRASDKFIFMHSKLLDKCEKGDIVMADKGFQIKNECISVGVQLIQPPFLKNKSSLSVEECAENNSIARARVHVERIMQRIKVFDFFNGQIDLTFLESIDKIMLIVCALVNLSEPILSDDKF